MQTHIRLENDVQIAGEVVGQDRIETGPLKFGDDWCGVFIRGDDCGRFLKAFESCRPSDMNAAGVLSELMQLMESSFEDD